MFGRALRGGALLLVALLAAAGVVQIARWVEHSEALPLRTIGVHGVDGARIDEVLAYAGVASGQPLFAIDIDAVAQRVLEHPFIDSATVRRVPPDGLEIAVVPRSAAAVLIADETTYLVDAAGRVMKSARPGDGLDLPVITGFVAADVSSGAATADLGGAVALAAAYEKAGAVAGPLREVSAVAGIGYDVVAAAKGGPVRIRVGRDHIEEKLTQLGAVVRRLDEDGRSASFIYLDDARRPERTAVRLRPRAGTPSTGGNKELPRERG